MAVTASGRAMALAALALAMGACDTADGDTADGDTADGQGLDGGSADGEPGGGDASPPDGPVALPVDRIDGAGFVWDIQPDGALRQGTFDEYEGYPTFSDAAWLTLDGQRAPEVAVAQQALDGRELVLGPSPIAGLELTRRIYVPADSQFARFVEVLRNPGDAPVVVEVGFGVGFVLGPHYVDDSDGDDRLTIDDDWWLAVDVPEKHGNPALVGAILSDADALVQPHAAGYDRASDALAWALRVAVPAGGEVRVMHVLAQHDRFSAGEARANVDTLRAWPDALFAGLTPLQRTTIVNLDVDIDTDDDGLADIFEDERGTDPDDPDTDDDGLLDGFDPHAPGEQGLDGDGDGLDNLAEQAFGSDPTAADGTGTASTISPSATRAPIRSTPTATAAAARTGPRSPAAPIRSIRPTTSSRSGCPIPWWTGAASSGRFSATTGSTRRTSAANRGSTPSAGPSPSPARAPSGSEGGSCASVQPASVSWRWDGGSMCPRIAASPASSRC